MDEFIKSIIAVLIGYVFIKLLTGTCNDFHVINL
jgi:hypothetical protein